MPVDIKKLKSLCESRRGESLVADVGIAIELANAVPGLIEEVERLRAVLDRVVPLAHRLEYREIVDLVEDALG